MYEQAFVRYIQSESRIKQFTIGLFGEYEQKFINRVNVVRVRFDGLCSIPKEPIKHIHFNSFWQIFVYVECDITQKNRAQYIRTFLELNKEYLNYAVTNSDDWDCNYSVEISKIGVYIKVNNVFTTALYTVLRSRRASENKILIRELLRNGADPNLCIPGLLSPLEIALKAGDKGIITLLLQYGALPIIDVT